MIRPLAATPKHPVAIIGAGVGGLVLALQLHRHGIPFVVYEARASTQPVHDVGATVALAPNCVRLLDDLGIYERAKALGKTSERVNVVNEHCESIETYCVGDVAAFGYPNLRIYRHEVVEEMRKAVVERAGDACFRWAAKFSHIVRDSTDGVVFELADGQQQTAAAVVGADGIHSRVRGHVSNVIPAYIGSLIPMAVIMGRPPMPNGQPDFKLPASVMCKQGSFSIIPQKADLSQTLCFRQIAGFPERNRAGWEALNQNKEELLALLRKDIDQWPEFVQTMMNAVKAEHMTMWPIHQLPSLDRWYSQSGRVILVGDSAHALPPSSGQGAASAVEDGYSLGLVLQAITTEHKDHLQALQVWQAMRTTRVDQIKSLARQNNARRLPEEERKAALDKEKDLNGTLESMRWLHGYKLLDDLAAHLSSVPVQV